MSATVTREQKITELKAIMTEAERYCRNEPEAGGDKGACLDYKGYWQAKKQLAELENEDFN